MGKRYIIIYINMRKSNFKITSRWQFTPTRLKIQDKIWLEVNMEL